MVKEMFNHSDNEMKLLTEANGQCNMVKLFITAHRELQLMRKLHASIAAFKKRTLCYIYYCKWNISEDAERVLPIVGAVCEILRGDYVLLWLDEGSHPFSRTLL